MLSIGHLSLRRRRKGDAGWVPSQWQIWSAPPGARTYVLVVDAVALAVVAATAFALPVRSSDWIHFAVLAAGSTVHLEASRGIERLRELASEGMPYVNLKGMWTFAGVVVLPPVLAALLIAVAYVHSWLRLRRVMPHRWFFSAATVVLAAAAAGVCLVTIAPGSYPGYAGGPWGLLAAAAAALAYWFINYALVVGAILLSNPEGPARAALGNLSEQFIAAGSFGLGIAVSVLIRHDPWSVVVLLLTVLGLHRALLVDQFQAAARKDSSTGLANTVFWHEMARKELARAQRTETPLGVLYVDLDHFKQVNDTYGHIAGDLVLKAIATELTKGLRTDDLVGRLGGEEFAVLLPNTSRAETTAAAERLRRGVERLRVAVTTDSGPVTLDQLTCSIGAATFPTAGATLDELLLAADTAAYAAKAAGRNTVVTAPATS